MAMNRSDIPPAAGVQVKALEWEEQHRPEYLYPYTWHGHGARKHEYTIFQAEAGYCLQHRGKFDTLAEAQAAAQADYETRIRSALIAPPAAEPWAWRYTSQDISGDEWPWTYTENRAVAERQPIVEPLYAAPPAAGVQAVPSGWVAVPREPLPEMLGAWYRVKNGHHFHDEPPPTDTSDYAAYRAMIAAAPAPPVGEDR